MPNFELRDGTYHVVVSGSVDGGWVFDKATSVVTFTDGALADWPVEGVYVPATGPNDKDTIYLRPPDDDRSPDVAAFPACNPAAPNPSQSPAPTAGSGSVQTGPAPGAYDCKSASAFADALVLNSDGTYSATDALPGGFHRGTWSYDATTGVVTFSGSLADKGYNGRMLDDGSIYRFPGPTLAVVPMARPAPLGGPLELGCQIGRF